MHNDYSAYAQPTALASLLEEVGLQDIWRVKFPTLRQFSCYTTSHHTLSRIDVAFGLIWDAMKAYLRGTYITGKNPKPGISQWNYRLSVFSSTKNTLSRERVRVTYWPP